MFNGVFEFRLGVELVIAAIKDETVFYVGHIELHSIVLDFRAAKQQRSFFALQLDVLRLFG